MSLFPLTAPNGQLRIFQGQYVQKTSCETHRCESSLRTMNMKDLLHSSLLEISGPLKAKLKCIY